MKKPGLPNLSYASIEVQFGQNFKTISKGSKLMKRKQRRLSLS